MNLQPLVRLWLWISCLATLAGWTLSACGQLNRKGYLVFAVVATFAFLLWRRFLLTPVRSSGPGPARKDFSFSGFRRRFRRPLPLGFLVLATLAFLGGALYAPGNHTGLCYRTPRVLQWLAHDHWFWIHTANYRMNNRACGFEWLTAPILLFTRSDRLLFLVNFFPFLLLPGLIFSVFRRMGVRPGVAWCWMWLLPTGYCFLLQAGSIANDMFPLVYALAAVDFAFRARASGSLREASLSLLSAGLLTGAKASNLPLLLPWLVVFAPSVRLFLPRPFLACGALILAATISFLPTAILNVRYCGDWSGLNLERAGMNMRNPLVGLWGNPLILALENLVPPVFPMANWWNRYALTLMPEFIAKPLVINFENGFLQLGELQTEDSAGLGMGLSLLLIISTVWAWVNARKVLRNSDLSIHQSLILAAPWVSLLAFCLKSGMVTGARLIAPYYPLLLPLLLQCSGQELVIRQRWWRRFAVGTMLLAVPLIVLIPGRALWPAQTVLAKLQKANVAPRVVPRALQVYIVYFDRPDALGQVRKSLPRSVPVVGFMADGDDLDISFWRPFGRKRVEHVLLSDSAMEIRSRGIDYIVVGGANLEANHVSLSDWLERNNGEILATNIMTLKVNEGPKPWFTVKLRDTP